MTSVKICGIKTLDVVNTCNALAVDFVGFTFVDASPRFISLEQAAYLRAHLTHPKAVALVSDAEDTTLDTIAERVKPDYWQCHGHESVERIAAIKKRYGIPIIKAFGVGAPSDLKAITPYVPHIDWVLLDAKPPSNATTTGGHSTRFDWSMLSEWHAPKPWLLAGGLTPDSVKAAIAQTNPTGVDVASGVEEPRGEKSIAKIRAFLAQVRS